MSPGTLKYAIAEAQRFLRVAKFAEARLHNNPVYHIVEFASPSDTAAVKRASMDLSKALSAMRKPA